MSARARGFALALLVLLGALALFAGSTVRGLYRDDVDPLAPERGVVIPEGASLTGAARALVREGVLDHAWRLRLVARIEGGARSVKAGRYEFREGEAPAELLRRLVAGEVATIPVTLLEGWPLDRVALTLTDSLHLRAGVLDSLARHPSPALRAEFGLPEGATLEGYLFPDTYRFAEGVDPAEVLSELLDTLRGSLDDAMETRRKALGWTWHQVFTLASIVEAEATFDDERPRVAAVYLNRLSEGWKLEADPTVAYAVGKVGQRLFLRDLEVESAYNTYKHEGLPPGPINNPGLASIRAVLWPEPGFEAMYFVADGTGRHVFSRTWAEHSRAVAEYRRLMRERRGP